MQSVEDIVTRDKDNVIVIRKLTILNIKDITAYYRYIFNECDFNRDGHIRISELKEFLNTHEGDIPNQVVKCIHDKFNLSKDHKLSLEKFLNIVNHSTVIEPSEEIDSRNPNFPESSIKRKSLKLRMVTDTGLYEGECTYNLPNISILLLSIIQVICYYIDMYVCEDCISNSTEFDPSKKYEIWRFFTHILSHANDIHLYANVGFQTLLGVPLEILHSWRLPLIYFAGTIGGSLFHSVESKCFYLMGGSCGFYAFYSAHVAFELMNWREMNHPFVHLFISVILIALDVIRHYMEYSDYSAISISNLGGIVVGLLMGVTVLGNVKVTVMDKVIWYTCAGILCLLATTLVIWTISIDTSSTACYVFFAANDTDYQ